ncbi:hypothetical protein DUI87_24897 [Hirundo rustica rustica]|uniref:Uncharacterized protein n=1 Tax=Hirundo rustica rustica TaxID=333673 RepID=A0A3M0JJ11_HIRRU|nr:hypothetical protein DUI87_24897 [Hirundo rustica rustica]
MLVSVLSKLSQLAFKAITFLVNGPEPACQAGGQVTDLEPGFGLSVGSHRDFMLRPGEVTSIHNYKCAQIPDFPMRNEKVIGLRRENAGFVHSWRGTELNGAGFGDALRRHSLVMQRNSDYSFHPSVRETEELKGKATGLMSHDRKADPKDLPISSSSENGRVEFRKVAAQKAVLGSLCGTSQGAQPGHLRLTLEAPKVLQDTHEGEGKK